VRREDGAELTSVLKGSSTTLTSPSDATDSRRNHEKKWFKEKEIWCERDIDSCN